MTISDKNSPCVNNALKSLMKSRDKLKKDAVEHKFKAVCCEGTQRRTKRGTGLVSGTSVAPSQHALIIYAY